MFISFHKHAGQNLNIKVANKCFENVAKFKHFGMISTDQITLMKKLRTVLSSGNA
jgi:hypothetical protein